MELSLKLPKGKPPFIGIIFTDIREACTKNSDLIDTNNVNYFRIDLEPFSEGLHIRLLCEDPVGIRFYKNVKYDVVGLEKWLRDIKFHKRFNFAHMVKQYNAEMVVKTMPKQELFVLKVTKVCLHTGVIS